MAGKKIYDRDFLLALRNDPKSRKKPENLPDTIAREDRGGITDTNRYPLGGKLSGSLTKQNSQQGKNSGNRKKSKANIAIRSISESGEVKLNKTEDAWKPARFFVSSANMSDDEKEAPAKDAVPLTPRKDDRTTPGPGADKRGTRSTSDQEEWSTASARGSRTQFSVQSDKFKNKPLQIDEPLSSSQMFGTWGRGSSIKPPSVIADMYAALEDIGDDIDKRSPMNYSSKDPYNSEGTSLERPNYECPFEDGRGSRSGSQHRLHDNSQRSKSIPTSQQNLGKGNPPTAPRPRQQPLEQISPKQSNQLQCKIKNILEGYLKDCYTVSECVREDTSTSLLNSAFSQLVSESYICVLEISSTARLGSGTLFAHLIKRTSLSVESYCTGLEEVLSQVDNLLDIPKIWDYLAELIAPMIYENAVSLVRLHKSFDIIIKQGHASKLLDPLFKLVVIEKGPNYLHTLWQNSGLNLSDFMMSSQVNSFIQQNQFEFLLGGTNTVISQTELTYEQIHQKLLEFFENDYSLDDIFVWIKANIGERVKEKQFVRTLATAVFEDSIVESKLKTENLRKHYSLLKRIVDGRIDHELESLDALQALINKLEHPQGIFLSIIGALYNDSVFSHDSFVTWEIQLYKKAKPHVQPLPNQSGNQGLAIRAMAPTGPPTQASAPPNSDLKVSQMSQSKNLAFAPSVRPASLNYFGQPLLQSQPPRMPNHRPQIDEPLGSSQMFGTWGRGSNIKPPSMTASPMSANMYAALENIGNDIDKRSPMNYSSKDPYHSKGTSLEMANYKHTFEDEHGGFRSGSQHRSHDNSQRSKPMPTSQQNLPKSNPPTAPRPRQPPVEQISPEQSDQLQRKIKNILEEYLNDCYTVSECEEDIRTSLPQSAFSELVSESYIYVLERSKTARIGSGTLFAHLIKRTTLSVENYCTGLEEVLSQADDLTIDIPKIWDYLAEIIAPIIHENAVSLVRLHKSFEIIIKQGHASKLLDPLFKLVVIEKGPNYLHTLWQNSGLNLSDFMMSNQVNSFIQQNQFEFLLGGTNTVISQTELTYEQIHQKLLEFFENDNTLDDIFVWIEANVGERAKEKQFVRTLATAVFEDSIVKSKLKTENLRKHYSLLIRIVDGRIDFELECLYALQALINKLEHPQGIHLSICGALYDDSVFSHDSFVQWEISDNPAEQEGKGVALKQLTCFFTQLKEVDEETSSTEDA